MSKAVYDVEGNGLLVPFYDKKKGTLTPAITRMWCIVIYDLLTETYHKYGPDRLIEGYKKLQTYDEIIAHNGHGYDRDALIKIVGEPNNLGSLPSGGDTYIMSRLLFGPQDAPTPTGRHGMEAYGLMFKYPKLPFHEFNRYSEEMMTYCTRDVAINVRTYKYLEPLFGNDLKEAYEQELQTAMLLTKQMMSGVHLDTEAHASLIQTLHIAQAEAADKLTDISPPANTVVMRTPEYWYVPKELSGLNKELRYRTKGECTSAKLKSLLVKGPMKVKVKDFNPGSPTQLNDYFVNVLGYKPTSFTENGNPSYGEEVLLNMPYQEAEDIVEYKVATKRLSQCESWLHYLVDGKVYGSINSMGAVTYRCTHSNPNMAQIPASRKPFGKECREVWIAPPGMEMTGTDAKGLELRMLGNALYPFDGGRYIEMVLAGEVHDRNQNILELDTKDEAKTAIYAFNYAAGLLKLGKVVKNSAGIREAAYHVTLPRMYIAYLKENGWYNDENILYAKMGVVVRERLKGDMHGFDELLASLKSELNSYGWIKGIDGRRIPVEAEYAILNRRLQSDGGILMKYALNTHYEMCKHMEYNKEWMYLLNIHDEFQTAHTKGNGPLFRQIGNDSIRLAGEYLKMKCPLAGDSATGPNWSLTH